jgi:hypothetical protein
MQTSLSPSVCRAFLGCQIEKAVDELNLTKEIISWAAGGPGRHSTAVQRAQVRAAGFCPKRRTDCQGSYRVAKVKAICDDLLNSLENFCRNSPMFPWFCGWPADSLQNNSDLLQRNSDITAMEFQQFQ